MHIMDLVVYSLLIGVPVLILVEVLIYFSERSHKEEVAAKTRIKRELERQNFDAAADLRAKREYRRHHPSNAEDE